MPEPSCPEDKAIDSDSCECECLVQPGTCSGENQIYLNPPAPASPDDCGSCGCKYDAPLNNSGAETCAGYYGVVYSLDPPGCTCECFIEESDCEPFGVGENCSCKTCEDFSCCEDGDCDACHSCVDGECVPE